MTNRRCSALTVIMTILLWGLFYTIIVATAAIELEGMRIAVQWLHCNWLLVLQYCQMWYRMNIRRNVIWNFLICRNSRKLWNSGSERVPEVAVQYKRNILLQMYPFWYLLPSTYRTLWFSGELSELKFFELYQGNC